MSGDRAALLAAVLAAPDDNAPRLIFADFLDVDADPPEPERATVIRNGCRAPACTITAQSGSDSSYDPFRRYWAVNAGSGQRFKGLTRVVRAMLPRPDAVDTFVAMIRRGFVDEVCCRAVDWLAHAPALLLSHPVRTVTLTTRAVLAADANGWAEPADEAYFRRRWPRISFRMPPPDAPLYRNFGTEAAPRWERYE